MILREIHFFCLFVWIPSNPEIAYNWKKQTSLPLEHPDSPRQFLFSLWPLCFCIWLLRFSSHLYFSVHFTVSNPPTQILHSLPLPYLPTFFKEIPFKWFQLHPWAPSEFSWRSLIFLVTSHISIVSHLQMESIGFCVIQLSWDSYCSSLFPLLSSSVPTSVIEFMEIMCTTLPPQPMKKPFRAEITAFHFYISSI